MLDQTKSANKNLNIKSNNIKRVFQQIRLLSPISRVDLQKITALSWGAISMYVGELIEMDLIRESGSQNSSVGRKPKDIDINPSDNLLVGIDLNLSGVNAIVTDLKGRIIYSCRRMFVFKDKTDVIDSLAEILDEALKQFESKNIIGIGIATQGIVDSKKGISIYFPHIPDWENVNLKDIITEKYNIPVYLYHDPDCIMIAEKYQNQVWNKDITNAALVRLDNGIGMSLLAKGEIYSGSFDKSAELGHLVVNIDGPKCICGNFGCLETYASGDGLLHRFAEAVEENEFTIVDTASGTPLHYTDLAQAAEEGDELCIRLFNQMGKYLGLGISSVINLFDPSFIILYGNLSKYKDLFFSSMINAIEKCVWHENTANIIFSKLDQNAAAIGAALAASNRRLDETDDLTNL